MWIVVSDELEDVIRSLARKKGDISKLFETGMRMYFREQGIRFISKTLKEADGLNQSPNQKVET